MYLQNDGFSGYDRSVQQIRQRGLFLMLVQPPIGTTGPIKAVVRKVALRQFGHWMMGRAVIYGHSYTVSGAYGADGLLLTVDQEVYDRLPVELPQPLVDEWNHGDGWNGSGKEGPSIRAWAMQNVQALRQ